VDAEEGGDTDEGGDADADGVRAAALVLAGSPLAFEDVRGQGMVGLVQMMTRPRQRGRREV
jgi:hypothetical protein